MAKAKEIKPVLAKNTNGAWSARAVFRKPDGKTYHLTCAASPDMKIKQGKAYAIEMLERHTQELLAEHPDWVRIDPSEDE